MKTTDFGTPEGTRTPNPQNRNLMLYPLSYRRPLLTYYSKDFAECKGILLYYCVEYVKILHTEFVNNINLRRERRPGNE